MGHTLKGDLKGIEHEHPRELVRDVSRYRKYRDRVNGKRPLRVLADDFLQRVIQEGAHSSVEDAQAAMGLYREVQEEWENAIKQKKLSVKIESVKPPKVRKISEGE